MSGLDDRPQHADRLAGQRPEVLRLARVQTLVKVFGGEDGDEFGVAHIIVPDECHQFAQGLLRVGEVEAQLRFGLVEAGIDVLQHTDEQLFLAAEVVIDHPVVGLGQCGDLLDAPTSEAFLAEDLHCGLENIVPGAVGLLGANTGFANLHVGPCGAGQIANTATDLEPLRGFFGWAARSSPATRARRWRTS
ncbi:hypothetical protein D9M73_150030 [compost metagenome]